MVSDTLYELCLPVLQDTALEDEDKTEKLEELLRKETSVAGPALEDIILNVLWRFRESTAPSTASPPIRHTVIRRPSPAPWQVARAGTPLASPSASAASPAPPPGLGFAPPAFVRAKSSTASPFTSPRPSPRLAFTSPIPHSPSLNAYEFSDSAPTPEIYGDYGSDTVDWLVNDDTASNTSSAGGRYSGESGLSGAAAAWVQPQQMDMSSYDMLRSVLGDEKTDEEIEKALELNGYDLSATIMTLMDGQYMEPQRMHSDQSEQNGAVLVGKSMKSDTSIPMSSPEQPRSGVVCKYWLSHGQCFRADCRYSHDLSNHICKYWVMGNCLAGDTCIFSHDPSALMSRLTMDDGSMIVGTPPQQTVQPSLHLQDFDTFPTLQPMATTQWANPSYPSGYPSSIYGATAFNSAISASSKGHTSALQGSNGFARRPNSRPTSRHQSRERTPAIPVDDNEAFPSLASAGSSKAAKKHHGKRGGHGHGHGHSHSKESGGVPNSLADIVRMSPSPSPGHASLLRKGLMKNKSFTSSREYSAAASAIPAPQHIPWLETGDRANQQYLKARQDALRHGGLRNKFLQSAAQAWNRNDARAAKALSLRGQSENELMRKAHREAARVLYDQRNRPTSAAAAEIYVDLHGLHPDEAVEYLDKALRDQTAAARLVPDHPRHLYAITGTGHHSKNAKDKVGKAVRAFLADARYAFREFGVPGDRANVGGILGIDVGSGGAGGDGGKKGAGGASGDGEGDGLGLDIAEGKVRVVKAADVQPPATASMTTVTVTAPAKGKS